MKIVQVINAMISNQAKIDNVLRNGGEYFFRYNKKHKWSIIKDESNETYFIHFYPVENVSIEDLASDNNGWYSEFVTYSTADLKTNEAIESFRELYQIVTGKIYGIDDIFDEIIGDD